LVANVQATDEVTHVVVGQPELGLEIDSRPWEAVLRGESREDDHPDVGFRKPRPLQGHLHRRNSQVRGSNTIGGKASRLDASALLDPLVRGIDPVAVR
jgi:hypothetical protein